MPRYRLLLEYDGRFFCGWQRQDNALSVAAFLEQAIYGISGESTAVIGAGRTDKGVHAKGQVAHVDLARNFSSYALRHGLNAHLRHLSHQNKWHFSPLSVLEVESVCETFHARFSAKKRLYHYQIINRSSMLALQEGLCWHYYHPLNIAAMQEAAVLLQGYHDFKTFQAQGCQSQTSWRTLDRIEIHQREENILISVLAPSFLYHQVRNIVGTLVLVGQGKWSIKDFEKIFHQKDRTKAGPTAPAQGLYFMKVFY
jgi:tRNA pseudouridine38-40 synthase